MKTELHLPSDLRFLAIAEEWLFSTLKLELGNDIDWTRQTSRLRLALVEAYSNVVAEFEFEGAKEPVFGDRKKSQVAGEVKFGFHGLEHLQGKQIGRAHV